MSIKTTIFCNVCGCSDEGPFLVDGNGDKITTHGMMEFDFGKYEVDDPNHEMDIYHICEVCLKDIEQKLLKQLAPLKLELELSYTNNGIKIKFTRNPASVAGLIEEPPL